MDYPNNSVMPPVKPSGNQYNGYVPNNAQQTMQNFVENTVPAQKEKSGKGLAIAGTVLLVLGAVSFWFPIVGFIFCLLALIFFLVALKRKTERRGLRKAGMIVSIVFLSLAILMNIIILPRMSTIDTAVKETAIEKVCIQFGVKSINADKVTIEKIDDSHYRVGGVLDAMFTNYSDVEIQYYRINMDCIVSRIDTIEKVEENNSTMANEPYKRESLPEAITRINKTKALERAEEEFHRTVKLLDEASYVLNDHKIEASYERNGDIMVYVTLDYSARNRIGGMTRSGYIIELEYRNGSYRFVKGYETD